MQSNTDNYFIFCLYDSKYPHKVIIINENKCSLELSQKITDLKQLDSKIRCVFKNEIDCYYIDDNPVEALSQQIIDYWMKLLTYVDSDFDNFESYSDSLTYLYLSDQKYRLMSPNQLQTNLITERKSDTNNVWCTMVSDVDFDYVPNIIFRYFIVKKYTTDIMSILLELKKVTGVLGISPAKKSSTELDCWGYLKVANTDIMNILLSQGFDCVNGKFEFELV
ncbi:hypothetical protein QJ850_gp171 [Acanthamoeba polyphaga mimivirus]|uniref:Uncharacterized protein n=1 Tax=Acanthamoeba polyphaga mimivirus Kroon TaxID=3069720 RepID=A0A0G2Y410_9VIRU|nr:hypothetical protein QJ850_gp171 [Acanthamoeba polyphaga mimivirus]AKI80528.1 hypothetical protein [Acanthamoeba polyphaga mimivirus Kroon]